MKLLKSWKEVEVVSEQKITPPLIDRLALPRDAAYYSEQTHQLTSQDEMEGFVQLAGELELSFAVLAFSSCNKSCPLAVTLCESKDEKIRLFSAIIDLNSVADLHPLQQLVALPITFVGFDMAQALCSFWRHDIEPPEMLWDCQIAQKAMVLGIHHHRYQSQKETEISDVIAAQRLSVEKQEHACSLTTICLEHEVPLPLALQGFDKNLSGLSNNNLVDMTKALAQLYPAQVLSSTYNGLLTHLHRVEMPWTKTSARMAFNGVRIDQEKAEETLQRYTEERLQLEQQLAGFGLHSPRSCAEVAQFFDRNGLKLLSSNSGAVKLDKKVLKQHQDKHPAIPVLLDLRRTYSALECGLLNSKHIGNDGRIHAQPIQLGAHTGRQTCKNPNLLGIPSQLRSLIIAESGYGIGEVDLCQIEVGIAAAVYQDDKLIQLFNTADIYSSMAIEFYAEELTADELKLSPVEFKHSRPDLRTIMKTCTLSNIYGGSIEGLAALAGKTSHQVRPLFDRFLELFPALKQNQEGMALLAGRRGYAQCVGGLRRYRGKHGRVEKWEERWMINFPVQAGATVAFKMAGNRLDRLYQNYGAKLILPYHDAFVFECPMESLQEVADLTASVMRDCVQECFPKLQPRVEVNIKNPSFWNKL